MQKIIYLKLPTLLINKTSKNESKDILFDLLFSLWLGKNFIYTFELILKFYWWKCFWLLKVKLNLYLRKSKSIMFKEEAMPRRIIENKYKISQVTPRKA